MSSTNIAEEIKSRCNIVDVIGRVVPLKKAGSNYKGRCPFHNEKTPSFNVNEDRQFFKCFGCGASGDVISFTERYYNQDFREACEMLAREYGIDISDSFGGSGGKQRDELYEINRQAAAFFYRAFRSGMNPGYAYMKNRGISEETMNRFGIGYADGQWQTLLDHLTGLGASRDQLLQLGLISRSGDRYYDKFRDRVIFPIINTRGKVIGFGGRIIGDGNPKYLNSQESDIFQKKNNLYGLNLAKDDIRKEDRIVLVEGYMDVISLYQAGVRNVCASLGTALTENQARLIKRYTRNVILSYDADEAGQNAAMRGLDILYQEDLQPRVLRVTDGKDPDDFIKSHGRGSFIRLMDEALPLGDFKMARIGSRFDLTDEQQRLAYLREMIRQMQAMKPVEADLYINKLAAQTGISAQAIRLEYESGRQEAPGSQAARPDQVIRKENREPDRQISRVEGNLLKLMLVDLSFTRLPEDIRGRIFQGGDGAALYQLLREMAEGETGPVDPAKLRDRLDPEVYELYQRIDGIAVTADKEQIIFDQCVDYIRKEGLRQREQEIRWRLSSEDGSVPEEKIRALMEELAQIQKQLKCE